MWLAERVLKLIGEGSGSMPSSNSLAASVLGELENNALSVRTSRLHDGVSRVLNCHNHSGSQHKFVPAFADVDDKDSCTPTQTLQLEKHNTRITYLCIQIGQNAWHHSLIFHKHPLKQTTSHGLSIASHSHTAYHQLRTLGYQAISSHSIQLDAPLTLEGSLPVVETSSIGTLRIVLWMWSPYQIGQQNFFTLCNRQRQNLILSYGTWPVLYIHFALEIHTKTAKTIDTYQYGKRS